MAKASRKAREGMCYVTWTTHQRRPIFEITRTAESFIATLLHFRTLGYIKLHAYVILPGQVHLLLTPQSQPLEEAVAMVRDGFAQQMDSAVPVWEQKFSRYPVANIHEMEIVRAHLHQLPVRENLAASAELYPHSSAYRRAAAGNLFATAQESTRKPADSTTTSLRKVAS